MYINYYGLPCLCTVVKNGVVRTVTFDLRDGATDLLKRPQPIPAGDLKKQGFVLYAGRFFKNVNVKL